MPKHDRQKEKILAIKEILERETDENHSITVQELSRLLENEGISAERKSIYDDIHTLYDRDMDIVTQRGRGGGYQLMSRTFQLPEVTFLVDVVQSCRFITAKKSSELIKKLQTLCSRHEASALSRQVYVSDRIKSMNESIYYNINSIYTAIAENKKISFTYFHWEVDFSSPGSVRKAYHHNGEAYSVSPLALLIDNSNYYLVGYDHKAADIRNYRVDKMQGIKTTTLRDIPREIAESFSVPAYVKASFGMFAGQAVPVKLQVKNDLIGVVLDRFGKDIMPIKGPDDTFYLHIKAVPSPQFLSFVAGFGTDMKILEPQSLAKQMHDLACRIAASYEEA